MNLEKNQLQSFKAENFSVEKVLLEIEARTEKRLTSQSVLFFDEIQMQPKAVERIRYFYEERPEIKVVCAGSLLDLYLDEMEISFPVGRVTFLNFKG